MVIDAIFFLIGMVLLYVLGTAIVASPETALIVALCVFFAYRKDGVA